MDDDSKIVAILFIACGILAFTGIIGGLIYNSRPAVIQGNIIEKCLNMNHTIAECKELVK